MSEEQIDPRELPPSVWEELSEIMSEKDIPVAESNYRTVTADSVSKVTSRELTLNAQTKEGEGQRPYSSNSEQSIIINGLANHRNCIAADGLIKWANGCRAPKQLYFERTIRFNGNAENKEELRRKIANALNRVIPGEDNSINPEDMPIPDSLQDY